MRAMWRDARIVAALPLETLILTSFSRSFLSLLPRIGLAEEACPHYRFICYRRYPISRILSVAIFLANWSSEKCASVFRHSASRVDPQWVKLRFEVQPFVASGIDLAWIESEGE
ncbi:hypothetical protein B0J13DRAFT_558541 [Dactylonectria estremocensis]|uniref:Uncharacterized protein n=1 Tax=Dactylonectria estremocensis TaxID=1079267 RepID=A0A9P9EMK2_9HYPO|nr:hypothetical protein B0J13DRAFT_558541 [Dactylonectria estremocensis]